MKIAPLRVAAKRSFRPLKTVRALASPSRRPGSGEKRGQIMLTADIKEKRPRSLRDDLRILVVDDTPAICRMLSVWLTSDGHEVETVSTRSEALAAAARRSFDLVFLDLKLGDENGMDAIEPLLASSPWLRVVVITAYGAVDTAVEAMKRGASDYLNKSLTPAMVRLVIKK